jgi:hypothetical protein
MEAQTFPLGCVIVEVILGAFVGAVTPISIETGIAMVAPTTVDTLAPTVGANASVDCACEEDCNDCDDIEAPLLVDLVIIFKALPLLKGKHTKEFFREKVY